MIRDAFTDTSLSAISQMRDSNTRPADYKSAALPTELIWRNWCPSLIWRCLAELPRHGDPIKCHLDIWTSRSFYKSVPISVPMSILFLWASKTVPTSFRKNRVHVFILKGLYQGRKRAFDISAYAAYLDLGSFLLVVVVDVCGRDVPTRCNVLRRRQIDCMHTLQVTLDITELPNRESYYIHTITFSPSLLASDTHQHGVLAVADWNRLVIPCFGQVLNLRRVITVQYIGIHKAIELDLVNTG